MDYIIRLFPLIGGWILDLLLGDPRKLPHPVVGFGKVISEFEHKLNHGVNRKLKGGLMAVGLILGVYFLTYWILRKLAPFTTAHIAVETIGVFFCLAGTTLIREVRMVFKAADISLEAGRRQVSRIVGRDTASLSDREVRTAALETLAENLSDGVIAPLFWYALLGLPGMMAYKMVNTLDSMIGYRSERYREFGCVAARIDDVANYIPARLSAFLMTVASGRPGVWSFVLRYGKCHASPNSGWPEAALAGALDCRFGGPHDYFGKTVYKPYIGDNDRELTYADMEKATGINRRAEFLAVGLAAIARILPLI